MDQMRAPGKKWIQKQGSLLDEPPSMIVDAHSVALGSGFHAHNQFVVPMHHSHEKAFFVALSEAFCAWDEHDMETLVKKLEMLHEMTKREIPMWRHFRRRFFARRVKCACFGPSCLCWRDHAVFETFGPKIDLETNKPLFNERLVHVLKES